MQKSKKKKKSEGGLLFFPLRSVKVFSSEQERCGLEREVKAGHFCVSLTHTSSVEWPSDINKERTKPPCSSLFIARGAIYVPMTFPYIQYALF